MKIIHLILLFVHFESFHLPVAGFTSELDARKIANIWAGVHSRPVTSFHGVECARHKPVTQPVPGAESGLDSASSMYKYTIASNWNGTGCGSCFADKPPEEWKTDLDFNDSGWPSGVLSFGTNYLDYNYNVSGTLRTTWNREHGGLFLRRVSEVPKNLDVSTLVGVEADDDTLDFYINGVLALSGTFKVNFVTKQVTPEGRAALKVGQKNVFAINSYNYLNPAIVDAGLRSSELPWPCGDADEGHQCYQDAGGDPTKCCLVTDSNPNCCTGEDHTPDNESGKCRPPAPPVAEEKKSWWKKNFLLLIILLAVLLLLALLASIITAILCYRRRRKKSSYMSINVDESEHNANAYTPRAAVATPSQYQPSLPRIPVAGINVRNTNRTGGY